VALVDPHQLASVIRSSRLDKVSIIGVTFKKKELTTLTNTSGNGKNVF
jgi:hypothetical protein